MQASTTSLDRSSRVLGRVMPLAGICFAVLVAAGDLTIGPFPNDTNSPSDLAAYYAKNYATVGRGGTLMAVAAVFLAVFGASLWARLREADGPAFIGATVLIGTALSAMAELESGATYAMLGRIGNDNTVDPAALQAWHIASGFGIGGGTTVLLLGLFAAGLLSRALPAWLGVVGLILGIAQMTSFGFLAGLLFLPFAVITGIVLAVRPVRPPAHATAVESATAIA